MRAAIVFFSLIIPSAIFGQDSRWQLALQLQPEITFHQDNYLERREGNGKSTFNMGIASLVQYNLHEKFFLNAGVGFISRKLRTDTELNQGALRPRALAYYDIPFRTESVSYRILSFPLNIGYVFLNTESFRAFATSGFSGNFLVNTDYYADRKNHGVYNKRFWQGYSLMAGAGSDYRLSEKFVATASFSYAFVNKVKQDEFILTSSRSGLTVAHNYLILNLGVKRSL